MNEQAAGEHAALPPGLSADDLSIEPARPHDYPFDHDHADHHQFDHDHAHHHAEEVVPSWEGFVEGWNSGLYRDAVLGGALAAAALGLLGVFIVLRRAVFTAATVGQAAGLGVVLTLYAAIHLELEAPPLLGALSVAVLFTWMLTRRRHSARVPADAVLGLGFVLASSAALVLGQSIQQEAHEVSSILFGSAVVIRTRDLITLAGMLVLVLGVIGSCWRGLAFAGFDEDGARVQGLPVRPLNAVFWGVVAISIAISASVLGALPVFAFSVLPPIAALLLVRRLQTALLLATALGAASAVLGYLLAYFGSFPVGASQALLSTLVLVFAALLERVRR